MTRNRTRLLRHHSPTISVNWYLTVLLATTALTPLAALANPQGGTVVGGSAIIGQSTPNTLDVTQQTNRAIINWQSFSIGGNEATVFHQPTPSSVSLNRVTGVDPSSIAGSLKS